MKHITFFIAITLVLVAGNNLMAQNDTTSYKTSPFQMTFFPPLSTNGLDNANYVNNLSLNILAGVSGGVDGFEAASLINIDRYFVKGFQAAGIGNAVGGFVEGIQVAGIYNVAGGNVRYVQGAGIINVTGGNQFGLQGAGIGNVVGRDIFGFQGAGIMNVVGGSMTGVQGAGIFNVVGDTASGMQGAGIINAALAFNKGIQAAGIANITARGTVNAQAAGILNIANDIKGIQAAGILNRAAYVDGVQIAGILNICDSISGVPIGLINIVRYNGYRRFEVAASETEYVNISYKMGVPHFYTFLSAGKAFGPGSRFMYGFGIGTGFEMNQRTKVDIELARSQEIWLGDDRTAYFFHQRRYNVYNQLRASFAFKMGDRFVVFAGPTLNVAEAFTYDAYDLDIPWNPIAPSWAFYDRTYNNRSEYNLAIWLGLRGGIRF